MSPAKAAADIVKRSGMTGVAVLLVCLLGWQMLSKSPIAEAAEALAVHAADSQVEHAALEAKRAEVWKKQAEVNAEMIAGLRALNARLTEHANRQYHEDDPSGVLLAGVLARLDGISDRLARMETRLKDLSDR